MQCAQWRQTNHDHEESLNLTDLKISIELTNGGFGGEEGGGIMVRTLILVKL